MTFTLLRHLSANTQVAVFVDRVVVVMQRALLTALSQVLVQLVVGQEYLEAIVAFCHKARQRIVSLGTDSGVALSINTDAIIIAFALVDTVASIIPGVISTISIIVQTFWYCRS